MPTSVFSGLSPSEGHGHFHQKLKLQDKKKVPYEDCGLHCRLPSALPGNYQWSLCG